MIQFIRKNFYFISLPKLFPVKVGISVEFMRKPPEKINDFSLPVNLLSFDSITEILSKFPEINLEEDKFDP